ncbi:transcriptional regulator [Lentilactobacillus sp. Marseille-Q4993]|uniref:transcriptional regulator n=1 Tax=Lentilactobacillus sp. Marseille-Q4993 TaxID=3039492 RepID=UPI0024BD1B7D|nr:transcriptional regulator [Lentilactobacillus sp. Marseille-Q4993]
MEKALFNYIAEIISDYPETDHYIKEREDELMNQFQEFKDENVGGGRAQFKQNTGVEDMAITLSEDRKLNNLRRHAIAVKKCLDTSDDTTNLIIKELYLQKHQYLTIAGVAAKVYLSDRAVRERRNRFFESVAKELGL